ncbi:MAG: GDSL-type esterase/lipase family protein [Thermoanaerobaculia bacterium]
MRRFLTWYLPVTTALVASVVFAWGFVTGVRGNAGKAVVDDNPALIARPDPSGPLRVLILGDSVARGTGDTSGLGIGGTLDRELRERKLPFRPTVNLAVNGARTTDVLRQLQHANVKAVVADSNAIVLSIGGNDLWGELRGGPPSGNPEALMDDVGDRIERIVGGLRDANPTARIFVLGLYNPFIATPAGPVLSTAVQRWNAELMTRLADDRAAFVIPIADIFAARDRLALDRFHPGTEGYRLIAERIAQGL